MEFLRENVLFAGGEIVSKTPIIQTSLDGYPRGLVPGPAVDTYAGPTSVKSLTFRDFFFHCCYLKIEPAACGKASVCSLTSSVEAHCSVPASPFL